jgi:hypothetical protein
MPKTLITGAIKGLGYETARQLVAAGHTVYVGARNPVRGRQAAMRIGARFVELDVTDDASVSAAATTIAVDGGLDVLINNAGVAERTSAGEYLRAADETAESVRSPSTRSQSNMQRHTPTSGSTPPGRDSLPPNSTVTPAHNRSKMAQRSLCAWLRSVPTGQAVGSSISAAPSPGNEYGGF